MIGYLFGSVISGQRNPASWWRMMRRAKRASFCQLKMLLLRVLFTELSKMNKYNAFIESYAMGDMFWPCYRRYSARALYIPGVVNRTFENRTQSNSIELNPWIEFDWVRQSNEIEHHTFSEFDFRTNRIQSNKSNSIELNPSDWVRLSSETELNRTQLNGFRSIGSGESIQREP